MDRFWRGIRWINWIVIPGREREGKKVTKYSPNKYKIQDRAKLFFFWSGAELLISNIPVQSQSKYYRRSCAAVLNWHGNVSVPQEKVDLQLIFSDRVKALICFYIFSNNKLLLLDLFACGIELMIIIFAFGVDRSSARSGSSSSSRSRSLVVWLLWVESKQ